MEISLQIVSRISFRSLSLTEFITAGIDIIKVRGFVCGAVYTFRSLSTIHSCQCEFMFLGNDGRAITILLLNLDGGLCRVIHGDGLGRIGCYRKVTIPIVVPIICILIRIIAAQIEFLNPVPTGLQTLGKAECTV